MKKRVLFLSLLALAYLLDCGKNINIVPILTQNNCQIRKMFGKFKLLAIDYSDNKNDLIPFNLELNNRIINTNVSCYIKEKNISYYSFSIRNAYCYILSDLLNDLSNYNIASIYSKYDDIKIIDNFKLNGFNKYEYSNYNMSIFFRQVNNFTVEGENGIFMFYGLTKSTSSYSSQITLLININNNEIREAKCNEQYVENISLYINQITYKCEISKIKNNIIDLRILDSDDVSGIPYDYNDILRNPIETQNAIKSGTLVNYAESKSISLFNIHYTYLDNRRGILTFIGTIFGEIKENKVFPILITSSHRCQSKCYIPASTSGEEIQIKCILCNNISQKSNIIFEHQILKNGKDEILFFNEKTENYIASKINDVTIINGILGNYSENIYYTSLIEGNNYQKLNELAIKGIFDGIINIKINVKNQKTFLLNYALNCSLHNNLEGKAEIHCDTGDKLYQKIK